MASRERLSGLLEAVVGVGSTLDLTSTLSGSWRPPAGWPAPGTARSA